jgi:hypothetical protein
MGWGMRGTGSGMNPRAKSKGSMSSRRGRDGEGCEVERGAESRGV